MNPITQETLALMKQALSAPNDAIAKAISTGTGLVAYDLQAPAKNLYPFITPLRNVIPRVGGGTGTATNWRQVNAIIGSGFDAMGWVPEGQRSGQMSYSTSNKSATYVTIGEEDAATYEAISAGVHFEDIQSRMTFRLLQKMMLKEEMAILAGNAGASAGGISLGTPGTVSVSAIANTGSLLTTATYYVQVVALTLEGYQNSGGTPLNTVAGTANAAVTAAAVATQKSVTGADGKAYTLSGGSSNISALSSGQAVTSGTNMLAASVAAVSGAVAYAWFVGTTNAAGSGTLQAITPLNSVTISAPLVAGTQPAASITQDSSFNASYAYNGLLTTAFGSGTAYVNSLATGTPGTGTFLTSSGRGSVNEIDQMFQTMWNNFELSPTVLYVNAQELKNITSKVLTGASAPLLRYDRAGRRHGRRRIRDHRVGGGRLLLQPVRAQRRLAYPDKAASAGAAGDAHRLGREPADPVPVERGPERRRGQDPAGLLSNRLAHCHPPAPGRRLCRERARGLCALCDGCHHQHRQRLSRQRGVFICDRVRGARSRCPGGHRPRWRYAASGRAAARHRRIVDAKRGLHHADAVSHGALRCDVFHRHRGEPGGSCDGTPDRRRRETVLFGRARPAGGRDRQHLGGAP